MHAQRRTSKKISSLLIAAGLALAVAGIGSARSAAPATPSPTGPADGATFQALPTFSWEAVPGAEKYEFEIAADAGFNSPPIGTGTTGDAVFFTKNTRATVKKAIPNGEYWWHVRAIDEQGAVSAWSAARSFRKSWTTLPTHTSPANGATLTYPSDPLKLTWTSVERAATYQVWVSTDPTLGSPLWNGPVETQATSFTGSGTGALAPGRYYWAVTPLDAAGNPGARSAVTSFDWAWPTATATRFEDLHASPEVVDPHFSWDQVPGASGYEVEVNASQDWAAGSKVCCNPLRPGGDITTLATSLSPPEQLNNNTYYWRVRAIDVDGNAGIWNVGPSFWKTFANVPPTPAPSVKNLRVRDNLADPYNGQDPGTVPYPLSTGMPVVAWNPVPGASSYDVDVTPYEVNACDWSSNRPDHWVKTTSTTAWTALGAGWNGIKPFPHSTSVSHDGIKLFTAGQQYCVRVRPVDRARDLVGPTVLGDWTYLPANNSPAFQFTSYPASSPCSPCPMPASSYALPQTGTVAARMPLFTWQPVTGAASYFVLVARDASFTNVVDYAFTQLPAYAPRTGTQSKGYADETTLYYWAVLPADDMNGGGVSSDPRDGTPPNFHKQSTPPALLAPGAGEISTGPTLFRWTPAEGARRYWLEVSQDPSFANPIDRIPTDSTSYTSNTTYPADTVLYWRVRGEAEDGALQVGLTWSPTGTFQKRLPAPTTNPEPSQGNLVPTWLWSPIPGAISYDFRITRPDGVTQDIEGLRSAAFAPTLMAGTGIWRWQVRANFPTPTFSPVRGPYSPLRSFTRTMPEPANAASDTGPRHVVFRWDPRAEAEEYRVQVSPRADFATILSSVRTENTDFAPDLMSAAFGAGGTFYWRVATVDARNNVGDFTQARSFQLDATSSGTATRRMFLRSSGRAVFKRRTRLIIIARDATGAAVAGARVRIWGTGLSARTKTTGAAGKATFYIRPTRRGRLSVRATKAGFYPATLLVRVR
jgi:hypothetical protein